MAIIGIPLTGSVTSWGSGTDFVNRLVTMNLPKDFTLSHEGSTFDATGLAAATYMKTGKSLRSAKGSFTAHIKVPQDGRVGLVTYAAATVASLNSWNIDISREIAESTVFGDLWKRFTPGRVSWKGSYSGYQDDTTGPSLAIRTAEPAAAEFQVITGGAGRQLTGNIVTTSLSIPVKLGSIVTCEYGFEGDDKLVSVGTPTDNALWPADSTGALLAGKEEGKTLTLQTVTGQTISGKALWSSIKIANAVGSPVTLTVDFVFSETVSGLT